MDGPYLIQCEPGKKAICTCGRSSNLPFCDGTHKGTEDRPVIIDVDQPKTIAICSCGKTGTPPYCDGSHKSSSGN